MTTIRQKPWIEPMLLEYTLTFYIHKLHMKFCFAVKHFWENITVTITWNSK